MIGSSLEIRRISLIVSGMVSLSQVSRWAKTLVGHSLKFCSTFISAHLVGGWKLCTGYFCLGCYPQPSIGSLPCLQEVFMYFAFSYPLLLRVLARITLIDSIKFPFPRFLAHHRDIPHQLLFFLHPPHA